MTNAMEALRLQEVLALPVHDSLIIPRSADKDARACITMAFRLIARTSVRVR